MQQDAPAVSKLDSPKWLLATVISTIAKGWLPGIMAVQSVLESRVPFLERCWKQRETCGFQMRSNTSTRIGLNSPKHETKSSLQYFCKGHGRSFHRSTTRWNGQALNSFPKQDGWFAKRIRPTNPNHSQICGSPGKFWAVPNGCFLPRWTTFAIWSTQPILLILVSATSCSPKTPTEDSHKRWFSAKSLSIKWSVFYWVPNTFWDKRN